MYEAYSDRKLLAGLENDEQWQVARLPVSEALWSAWKRYCSAIGISMGRGLAALIQCELESVIGTEADTDLLAQVETQLTSQRGELAQRERRLAERELSIIKWQRFLEIAERVLSINPAQRRTERTLPLRVGSQVQTLPRRSAMWFRDEAFGCDLIEPNRGLATTIV